MSNGGHHNTTRQDWNKNLKSIEVLLNLNVSVKAEGPYKGSQSQSGVTESGNKVSCL